MAGELRGSTDSGRLAGLVPSLDWLRHYQRPWLRGDVLAGITVAAYLIPQVMAYAQVAGLPAVTGLWAIMGSLVAYAVLGSSRQLSVGPESTMALMTAAAVGPLALGDPARYALLAAGLAGVVGVICLAARLASLGFLADLLSKPVLVGYLSGVALIMIASQLGKLTGAPVAGQAFLAELGSFARGLDKVQPLTLILAAAVLAFLLTTSRLFPKAPVPLLGMALATTAVWALSLADNGLRLVGDLGAGLPRPTVPALSVADLSSLLLPAIGLAIVGYSDNVLTARSFATRNHYPIDANQELIALGTANLAAGVMQGFPVSSSASRTVIGDSLGSRSQLYSLVALASVVVTVLVLRPFLAAFPTAALGALVVYAALRLIDVAEFRRIGRFRSSELWLALATTAAVLVLGVLYGVLAAVGLSILDLLRRVARPHDAVLGFVPGVAGMHDVNDYPNARLVPGLIVYRYDSPLCFVNAEDFRRNALAALDSGQPPVHWFVLNAEANVEIDVTAADSLGELGSELDRLGIVFALARVKNDVLQRLRAGGMLDRIGTERIYATLPTAVQAYRSWHVEQYGVEPPGPREP